MLGDGGQEVSTYFPIFLNMEGKNIRVFGGGKIAARRVRALLQFGADVCVVAPEIAKELEDLAAISEKQKRPEDLQQFSGKQIQPERLAQHGQITLSYRKYQPGELTEEDFVFAATDNEQVNHAIFQECRHKEIPVNVSSDKEKCDFYFPGIVRDGDITIGIASGGKDHKKVAEVAARIREWLLCRK